MSPLDIIRAWKDPAYRDRLSAAEQALVPPHPSGRIELSAADLDQVVGGETNPTTPITTC